MRHDIEQGDTKIKQRIIGALVLVALVVIIVPSVLDLRQDYDKVIKGSNIPPKPADFKIEEFHFESSADIQVPTLISQLPVTGESESASARPEHAAVAAPSSPPAVTEQTPETERQQDVARVRELRDRRNDSVDGSVARAGQPAAESWVVQLATLSVKSNALALRDRVQAKGSPAFIVSVDIEGKSMYRVLAGPELLRSQAEQLRQRLAQEVNMDGLVIRHRR